MLRALLLSAVLGATSLNAVACRPPAYVPSQDLPQQVAFLRGVVTAAVHEDYERAVLGGEEPQWPGYSLRPYRVRIAVLERLLGDSDDVIALELSGCPPPWAPGDRVIVFVDAAGSRRLQREERVLDDVRA